MITFVNDIRKKIYRYSKVRRTINELERLTNRELSDIGISRCDIPRIAGNIEI